MPAHGLEGELQSGATVPSLVCLLDTQEKTSRVLAFSLFTDRFLFSFSGIGNGWGRRKGRGGLSVYSLPFQRFCVGSVVGREMEEKKSSFVDEFFPEKESALPSKSDILSSIFPPRSPVAVKDSFHYESAEMGARNQGNEGQSLTESMGASGGCIQVNPGKNQDGSKKKNEPNEPCEIAEPCLMSSSVYYGCRDDFIPEIASSYKSGSTDNDKEEGEDGGNSDVANRGEWWQGFMETLWKHKTTAFL